VIRLDDVSFSYDPGETPDVLSGVTVQINTGQYVAVLGRNGSGKSSFARLLNGLHHATRGRVDIGGLDPADPTDVIAVRRRVQMVFQNPENQQVGTTLYEDIAFGLANIGCPTALMRERAETALRLVGLDLPLEHDTSTLSGGQMQRLALASSLALEPDVLVLDEVTSMLDPESAAHFAATLTELRTSRPLTVIQITHHLDEIEGADRALLLHDGRIVADGAPAEIFADGELLERCGLQAPYRWRDEPDALRPIPTPPTTDEPIVATEDLAVDYGRVGRRGRIRRPRRGTTPHEVLADVSLSVSPGELVALAGRSGAGKSTLIGAVKGLVPPVRGVVRVADVDPWRDRRPAAFDRVGYVFQQPERQLFAASVRADVGYGLAASRIDDDERDRRIEGSLARLGLDPAEVADRSPFALSGGQQRRVAIAGVLVTGPDVLILDEPTAGLDHPSRRALFEILHEVRSSGTAVIWVSHRFEEVLENADRLVVIDNGTVAADGTPIDLLSDPDLRERMAWPLLPALDDDVREGEALELWRGVRP
jgi:energy-coupling factor transport system ATP-binding protein